MTSGHKFSQSSKWIAGAAALVGVGLHGAACQWGHFLTMLTREVLGVLPCLVLETLQALQAYTLDHQRLLECLCHVSVSSLWSVLLDMAGAI